MVVSLVGSCIALFGLNCWLAGRSGACKAADISTSLINIYTIVDMVSKKYTATVFFGHKWLTSLEAMAKDSWPNGVTSWDDTVKFARLVFGEKVSVEDYSHRLPRPSKRSFLLFAKGACGPGTPFQEIGELIEPHLEEVKQYELVHRRNAARPEKSQQMLGSDNWTVHYWSTQLTRAPCTRRSGFGADSHQKHVPTASDMWATGERFAKLWNVTLQKNFESFRDRRKRPIWLDKMWQAVWNWNDHNQGHGIALHPDECDTYSSSDPITSFSFRHGGVLTLSERKAAASKMLFQADGDALVMAQGGPFYSYTSYTSYTSYVDRNCT